MEGKKESFSGERRYQPNKSALRLYNMGKNTRRSGRMADTAEIWFMKAIAADPKFVVPHLSFAKFYLQKGSVSPDTARRGPHQGARKRRRPVRVGPPEVQRREDR